VNVFIVAESISFAAFAQLRAAPTDTSRLRMVVAWFGLVLAAAWLATCSRHITSTQNPLKRALRERPPEYRMIVHGRGRLFTVTGLLGGILPALVALMGTLLLVLPQ